MTTVADVQHRFDRAELAAVAPRVCQGWAHGAGRWRLASIQLSPLAKS